MFSLTRAFLKMSNLTHGLLIVLYLTSVLATNTLKTTSSSKAESPYLKVHFFPSGEGEATVIECHDAPNLENGSVTITLINAGSVSAKRKSIQLEYFKFLDSRLRLPNSRLQNIILTNPDPKLYNFIAPFVVAGRVDIMKVHFYIGGERDAYNLEQILDMHNHVYEFSRETVGHGNIGSCGHYGENRKDFLRCIKRGRWGSVQNSDEIIQLCDNFQASVMAANYGILEKEKEKKRTVRDSVEIQKKINASNDESSGSGLKLEPEKTAPDTSGNHLILKITPSGKATPSILLGNFESITDDKNKDYYSLIKESHTYHKDSGTLPLTLTGGLASTVVNIPQNSIPRDNELDEKFYSEFIQPTFAVASSDITDNSKHPRCELMQSVNSYLRMFSSSEKTYECHPKDTIHKETDDMDILALSSGSDNLYQTSIIDLREVPNGKVLYNLVTFKMTQDTIPKPLYRVFYKEERHIPKDRVTYKG